MATRDLLDHNAFAPFSVRDCALLIVRGEPLRIARGKHMEPSWKVPLELKIMSSVGERT
jgi:hypothetical protein